jgi:hypothetical protein
VILRHRLGRPMSRPLSAFAVVGLLCACSSAGLDPNSRALTFYTPNPNTPGAAGTPGLPPGMQRRQPKLSATVPSATMPATAVVNDRAGPKPPSCSSLPDPSPTHTDRWVALAVRLDKSDIDIASASQHRTRRLETTRRQIGRFAAELWIGCELIDRVRFDFPLLAGQSTSDRSTTPNFEAAGRFEATLLVPDSDRATRLELVDRAKRTRKLFDWPLRMPPRVESR